MESVDDRLKFIKPIRAKIEEEEEEGEPLSPVARVFHEPTFNLCIVAILGFKSRINPDIFKAGMLQNLPKQPRFSCLLQVVDGKTMKWVPTEVDLDNHVIVPEIDPNMESPEKFMEDYISNLSTSTMDTSKPLWDLHLLNVKTSDAEAVGVFRIHHSLGDGMSLISFLLACTRKVSDPEVPPTLPAAKLKPNWSQSSEFGFWWACRLVWNSIVDVLMFVATILFLKDDKTPIKVTTSMMRPRRFIHRIVSLDDIKLVKNAMNTTINDVVMGVAEAGLSRYLNRRYGEGKKYDGALDNLPNNLRVRAHLLIDLRPSPGIHPLVNMLEDAKAKWGNMFGYVLLPFTIALRDDPLDYIRNAKVTIDRKKHSIEPLCITYIIKFILKFFGAKVAGFVFQRSVLQTTMSFSNIVGPVEEIGFYGHTIAYIAPTCYGLPNAFMIHFQSYVNKMTFVLSVDEGTILDPHQLGDDLEESLNLIKDAVITKGW